MEAGLQPAQVARRLWHHLRGEDTSLALLSLLPGPATQAAALGMFLKLRPAGIPSQSCRTGAVSLGQVTDSLQKGLSLLAAHCSGNGSNMNWDLWVLSKVLLPRALLWVKVAQIPQFYAATGHITAGRGCIQGLWLL